MSLSCLQLLHEVFSVGGTSDLFSFVGNWWLFDGSVVAAYVLSTSAFRLLSSRRVIVTPIFWLTALLQDKVELEWGPIKGNLSSCLRRACKSGALAGPTQPRDQRATATLGNRICWIEAVEKGPKGTATSEERKHVAGRVDDARALRTQGRR